MLTRREEEKFRIAVVLGDPGGVGPELVALTLGKTGFHKTAELTLVGGRREFEIGIETARDAGATIDASELRAIPFVEHGENLPDFPRGTPSEAAGRYALASLSTAIGLAMAGRIDAICYAPLNKTSMHLAGMSHADELRWLADELGFRDPVSELNVLDDLWTIRVTSHVPLKDVAGLITPDGVAEAVEMLHGALRRAGVDGPRIVVAGLNPHAGENGTFGTEEIDIIAPGVALAKSRGIVAEGPYPADTVFLRAREGACDGVVTMYHDQGQIAIKLLGFDRGVTVAGGLPIAVTTPAHGTAYDIVGTGRANTGAMARALNLAARLADTKLQSSRIT